MDEFNKTKKQGRVAVVGLGAGTMAAYAEKGQHWTFYEIDPPVERLARNTDYFTYVHDAEERGVTIQVVLGDGRLRLKESSEKFDLILLDAFGSDAIPVHILTREALQVYLNHLEPNGVLAFHISSLNLFLYPVVANLAADADLVCLIQQQFLKEDDPALKAGKQSSEWVLMARRLEDLGKVAQDKRWKRLPGQPGFALWTDDFSNLFSVINWDGRPKYVR
jgi:protein-L-isoaspartate O-methyltransferase